MANLAGNWRRYCNAMVVAGACLLLLAATGSTDAPAATRALPDGALRPTIRQRLLAPRIANLLEQAHFSRKRVDDALSAQVLDHFVGSLDSQRSYFNATDIAAFARWRNGFDDMIHSGDVAPSFEIFATFQQRNRQRMEYALSLLAREPDWTAKESFRFDRSKAAWAKDDAELDEIWRQRVKSDALALLLAGKTWPEAVDTLTKRYERVLMRIEQVKGDEVFEALMNAYAAVYDPHSNYFSPVNTEENRIQMSLSYDGIGATLQLVEDYVTISNLISGGPAAAAGTLQINDRILAVGQGRSGAMTEVIGWRLEDVVQLIRGRNGTSVRLQILPAGAAPGSSERVVELARGKVTLETQAAKKQLKLIKADGRDVRVGVISVPGFYQDLQARSAGDENYRSTTRDVRRLIAELQADGGIDSLVLDLRGDGGGFLPEATALTGLFIDRGPVVQLKDTEGNVEVLDDPEPGVVYGGPLIVLVDRTSASASEIFAGAIQDYRRGLIVGQTTFGKGTVQNQIKLDRWASSTDGQINVTIGKFYRVTGESTQLRGVEPDVQLPSAISANDVGESSLEHPLPWDRIQAARFTPLPTPVQTADLVREQTSRAGKDANYAWLVDSLKALDAAREDKTLSLNLKDRQLQRTGQDRARLERENTRRGIAGLPALKSLEEMKADDQPDVILAQASGIAADLVLRQAAQVAQKTAP